MWIYQQIVMAIYLVFISNCMTIDPYHYIYQGEIFLKSKCIWKENTLLDFFRSLLLSLDYTAIDESNKVWKRDHQQIVLCLVDDYATCAKSLEPNTPYLFDKQTIVITDNHVTCPTQYKVLQVPVSFFGIYSYTPDALAYKPSRRFTLSINRLDIKRLLILLEAIRNGSINYPDPVTLDWINFNCWIWGEDNTLDGQPRENFIKIWQLLEPHHQLRYKSCFELLLSNLPFRNHDMSVEQAGMSTFMNLVVETYSSESTVALSEKTFRALVTPAPWMLYAGRYSVAWLTSLGFDVVADLVPHAYDRLLEKDKNIEFICEAANISHEVSKISRSQLTDRFQQAAVHNQLLLQSLCQQWPGDLAAWLPTIIDHIK